jgi:hypothetical protein
MARSRMKRLFWEWAPVTMLLISDVFVFFGNWHYAYYLVTISLLLWVSPHRREALRSSTE